MRHFTRTLLACTTGLLLAAPPALGDRIELDTGEVFLGKILRHNEEEVSIKLESGGMVSFKWASIRRAKKGSEALERKAETPRPFDPPPVKRKPPTPEVRPVPPNLTPFALEKGTAGPSRPPAPEARPLEVDRDPGEPRRIYTATALPASQEPRKDDENLFKDSERGFAASPPKGFARWPEGQSAAVPHAFMEPFTRSSFTVSTYATPEALLQVKKNTLRSYSALYKVFRVTRDEKLTLEGRADGAEAWIVEIENHLGSQTVRQLQVFAKKDPNVIVLTYSATGESFPKYAEAFEKSFKSFRLVAEREGEAPAEPPQGPPR